MTPWHCSFDFSDSFVIRHPTFKIRLFNGFLKLCGETLPSAGCVTLAPVVGFFYFWRWLKLIKIVPRYLGREKICKRAVAVAE